MLCDFLCLTPSINFLITSYCKWQKVGLRVPVCHTSSSLEVCYVPIHSESLQNIFILYLANGTDYKYSYHKTSFFPAVISHDGSVCTIHSSCGSTAHCRHSLLLFCWECVLCHTHCHLMLILPSHFNPLCNTLWVCARSWTVFYLQHHYGVLARWPHSWC